MKSLILPCCLFILLAEAQLISALIHSSQPKNEAFYLLRSIIHPEEEVHGLRRNEGKEMERTLKEKLRFASRKAQGRRGGGSTLVHQPRSSKSSAASPVKKQFLVSSTVQCLTLSFSLAFVLIL